MNIKEAHTIFRSIAQEQGMQTVRAILPEDIDICLNMSIINKVHSIVKDNTTTLFREKFVTPQHISPINSIRTLYKENIVYDIKGDGDIINPYNINITPIFDSEVLYYIGFSLIYKNNNKKSYSCRIIEETLLEDTMNDYCNKNDWDTPIVNIKSGNENSMVVDIYGGDIKPYIVKVKYIKYPNVVKYSDIDSECINPDIPRGLMNDIIIDGVNIYFNSIKATTHN